MSLLDKLNGELDDFMAALEAEVSDGLQADPDVEKGVTEEGLTEGTEAIIRERTAQIMSVNEDDRFVPAGTKQYDITKLRDHQQEILRLLGTGMKPKTIALILDIHIQTVSNVRNSELGQALLSMLHTERNITIAKTSERIDALSPIAADIMEEIMTDEEEDSSLKYRAARDTLKANGIFVEKNPVILDSPYLTAEEIATMKGKFKKDFDGEDITDVVFTDEAIRSEAFAEKGEVVE